MIKYLTFLFIIVLGGCIHNSPELDQEIGITLKTRVVVEEDYLPKFLMGEGFLCRQVDYVEKLYRPIGLKIWVDKFDTIKFVGDEERYYPCQIDAILNPEYLNIYVCKLPILRTSPVTEAIGAAPSFSDKSRNFIVVACFATFNIMAHEIGHLGGLSHTWDIDNRITDVPNTKDVNYLNIMNYPRMIDNRHEDYFISPRQLSAVKEYFLNSREEYPWIIAH